MFAKVINKYIGKKFKKGGYGSDAIGLDCIGLIYSIQKDLGKDIPDYYGNDINAENYYHLYEPDKIKEGYRIMQEWFNTFAEEIDVTKILSGDIVLFEQKKTDILFPSIFIGNGKYITSTVNSGVISLIADENHQPVKAWRVRGWVQNEK